MSEVSFAKGFLATLDKRPIKLPADHVSDPRKYPGQSPTPTSADQQAKNKTVTATLKPMRGGEMTTISDLTLQSTIHDVKTQYAQKSGQPQDKIKLLLNKKPAADLKTLSDLGIDGETVDFTVMLMGGTSGTGSAVASPVVEKSEAAATAAPGAAAVATADKMDIDSKTPAPESEKAQAEASAKPEPSSVDSILSSEEFWSDLRGFLAQRLRNEGEGEKLAKVFRDAHGRSK